MEEKFNQIKQTGATFTPKELANYLAKKLITFQSCDNLKILDPACGDGALLLAISSILNERNTKFALYGYDTNQGYINTAEKKLSFNNHVNLRTADFLDTIDLATEQLSLFNSKSEALNNFADLIIANPPYVRTQTLGAIKAQLIAKKFGLKGRVDLYYPFLIAMTHALKEDGILGVITSNRYLFTKSGASIRQFLTENYEILEVIDLGDTKLFDAAVLPAIFIGRKKVKTTTPNSLVRFIKIYEELNGYTGKVTAKKSIFQILNTKKNGYFSVDSKKYKKTSGTLKFGNTKEHIWSMLSKEEMLWVAQIENNSTSQIKDHFKVRVGIKTTADKVFISDNWDKLNGTKPEDELLKDLISQENIKSWKICHSKKLKVLYPHFSEDGKKQTIDLKNYPKAKTYFLNHQEKLKSRKYLINSGRNWFEIWVPQNPSYWQLPKLVFPDISKTPRFYYDNSGKIVNGNCYWIAAEKENDKELLLLIQGIANSKLMTKYHDLVFNNKLYSGRRRYFSQYVESYPLPNIYSKESIEIIQVVKKIHTTNQQIDSLLVQLENAVANAYKTQPIYTLD